MLFKNNIVKNNDLHNKTTNYFKIFLLFTLVFILYLYKYILLNHKILKKRNVKKEIIYQNKIKVCLCAIGKGEKIYAKEYINYYEKLGYNHVFLYDNNDINGEIFEDVIQDELKKGFVTIINYRGKRGKSYINGFLMDSQIEAYYDCYEKNNKTYNWLSFFDFDEFLELKPININIQQFLSHKRYKNCQVIKFNFLFYSDNELLYYNNNPVQKRFLAPLINHTNNKYIKSTVRGRLSINYWKNGNNPHSGKIKYKTCNSNGEIINYKSIKNKHINFTFAALKHYSTKSVEEYYYKVKRGYPYYKTKDYLFNLEKIIGKINFYFIYNKKTKKKIKLFKKLFEIKYDINKLIK